MAIFSANISDSSDEEDEIPVATPPDSPKGRHVSVSVLGEQSASEEEDEDDVDDLDDELSDSASSSSSEMNEDELFNSRLTSPTAHRGATTEKVWAQQVGVDPSRMHVMQASLFRAPEEAALIKSHAVSRAKKDPRTRFATNMLLRKHSRDSENDTQRLYASKDRPSFAYNIDPLPYQPSRKYARVESAKSTINNCEGSIVDAGLSMGRSFRVSWGPGGKLAHLGSICKPTSLSKISANSSIAYVSQVPMFETNEGDVRTRLIRILDHSLKITPIGKDADKHPCAEPNSSTNFATFASLYPASDKSLDAEIFRLGCALFDDMDLRLSESVSFETRNRIAAIRRRDALSAWLEEAVAPLIDAEMKASSFRSPSAKAFTLLSGNQIEAACTAAMDAGNIGMATLIAQAGGDFEFREDVKEQLRIWKDERVDAHIDEDTRKIYGLISGIVDILEGSKGTGFEQCPDVNVGANLDWKRSFGSHLWFAEPIDAPISSVFSAYTNSAAGSASAKAAPDAFLYNLLELHSDSTCSLSDILAPSSFGPHLLDVALPWHLYIILSRCMQTRDFADRQAAGVDPADVAEGEIVEGHSPSADILTSQYAYQLESLGMLQEAVFVLLHIEGSSGREKAIRDMLVRNASKIDQYSIRGLAGSLRIPLPWINEAQAIHALQKHQMYEAWDKYMLATMHPEAHEIAVLELAPDIVIRGDLHLLEHIFKAIHNHSKIDDWYVRGQVFLDYAHIMIRIPELLEDIEDQEGDDVSVGYKEAQLDDLARQIPKVISLLPDVLRDRSDARHNAAIDVMVAGLTERLNKVNPTLLSSSLLRRQGLLSEASKLRHIQASTYHNFGKEDS